MCHPCVHTLPALATYVYILCPVRVRPMCGKFAPLASRGGPGRRRGLRPRRPLGRRRGPRPRRWPTRPPPRGGAGLRPCLADPALRAPGFPGRRRGPRPRRCPPPPPRGGAALTGTLRLPGRRRGPRAPLMPASRAPRPRPRFLSPRLEPRFLVVSGVSDPVERRWRARTVPTGRRARPRAGPVVPLGGLAQPLRAGGRGDK